MRKPFVLLTCLLTTMAMPAIAQTSVVNTPVTNQASPRLAPKAVDNFYIARNDKNAWAKDADFESLIIAIAGLDAHGLTPQHYHLSALMSARSDPAKRERLATDAWLSAAAHMLHGKLDPVSVEPDWTAAKRVGNLPELLTAMLADGTIEQSLNALAPKQNGYKSLLAEYARLKTLAAIPVTKIPSGETLKPNMKSPRVATLQARLIQLELLAPEAVSGVMDEATDIAIKTFQTRQGLDSDGVVGAASLAAFNRGVDEELAQVRVNLERWRWLPDDLGKRHVRANIAGFNVTTWANNAPVRTHLTMVGKTYRKTPVFSDEISYVVLNPWWETPVSLARADNLSKFKRDASTVDRLGFQILGSDGKEITNVDWSTVTPSTMPRIRQRPGPMNAMGQVKIMFPNKHNVYFHDTPSRDLFAARQRAFSSGCLRTQDPIGLTKWLFEDTPDWTAEKIDAALASGKETRANLSSKIPVHVLYFTVVSEADGNVRYLDDIYQRDNAVLTGLRVAPRPS